MSPNPSHNTSTPLPSDLSKLNVSQLKAICKERRIVGYSKLGKAALIRRLGEVVPSSQSPSSAQTPSTRTRAQANPQPLESGSSLDQVNDSLVQRPMGMPSLDFSPNATNKVHGTHTPQSSATSGLGTIPPSFLSGDQGQNSNPSASALNVPVSKRIFSEISSDISQGHASASVQHARPLAKKLKVFAVPSPLSARPAGILFLTSESVHVLGLGDRDGVPDSSFSALPGFASVPGLREKEEHQLNGQTQTISMSGKRFKPLEVTRPLSATLGDRTGSRCSQANKPTNMTVQPLLWHLDFSAPLESPLLSAITLPPPLTQRKFVQRWAIILSGLSNKERVRCCLVSKLIRYAIFSSAYYNLSRYFSGQRLSLVVRQSNSPLMTNFWPYLRQREQEVSERKNAVMSSFFEPAFRGPSELISERLWSSPDNEKQVMVALRFLLTRVWFSLSVGTEYGGRVRTNWLHHTITDAVEIVKDEIWSVTTRDTISGYQQVFHVLEATCEVLGLAGGTPGDDDHPHVRLDWAAYIGQRKSNPDDNTSPLCNAMRWADHAEFDRGISRHWLSRTAQMGEIGAILCMIAERYTLACIVGNSLSGRWMSAPQMAQEFAGLVEHKTLSVPAKAKVSRVNLFLPAHHHVESVHLTATGTGRPLHPALAVVQTPAREYYVLRDNGFEVGCEEEGVASVWMRILGCDARGEPVGLGRGALSFEELKAYIQNL